MKGGTMGMPKVAVSVVLERRAVDAGTARRTAVNKEVPGGVWALTLQKIPRHDVFYVNMPPQIFVGTASTRVEAPDVLSPRSTAGDGKGF